jgi:hypothetical protein
MLTLPENKCRLGWYEQCLLHDLLSPRHRRQGFLSASCKGLASSSSWKGESGVLTSWIDKREGDSKQGTYDTFWDAKVQASEPSQSIVIREGEASGGAATGVDAWPPIARVILPGPRHHDDSV